MTFYLDTSAIVPLFVPEPASAAITALLGGSPEPLVVSEFAAGEFASALSRLVRSSRITENTARAALVDFDSWRIAYCLSPVLDAIDIRAAAAFVRRFDLKLLLPDAVHAAMSQRLGATLIIFDRRLADAATALGIAARVIA